MSDAIVLGVAPDGLAPAVVLLLLGQKIAVGLLRLGEEEQVLAGDLWITGDVVAVGNVCAVAEIEGVVVEFVDRLPGDL